MVYRKTQMMTSGRQMEALGLGFHSSVVMAYLGLGDARKIDTPIFLRLVCFICYLKPTTIRLQTCSGQGSFLYLWHKSVSKRCVLKNHHPHYCCFLHFCFYYNFSKKFIIPVFIISPISKSSRLFITQYCHC